MKEGRNQGANGWTLFTDAIDEAQASGARSQRKAVIGRPKRRLVDVATKQLKIAEQVRKRLDKQLVAQGPDWIPDEAFVEAFSATTSAIVQLDRSIRLGREAETKSRGGLTEDQLDDVWRVELRRLARQLDEEDWRALLSLGMGEDIAEAAIKLWKQRLDDGAATRAKTHIQPEAEA